MPDLKTLVVNALSEIKAQDVEVMDVSNITVITDYMIVATGTSVTHLNAICQKVSEAAKRHGCEVHLEGQPGSDWMLLDLGDCVVHVMLEEARDYYQLEKLWQFEPVEEKFFAVV